MQNDVKKALEKLDKKIRNKVLKKALKDALKPLAEAIKADAPVDTGDLKSHIKVKPGKRKKDHVVMAVEVATTVGDGHAGRVEFGTREMRPEPFIRPNAKALREQIVEAVRDALDRAVKAL